MFSRWIDRFAKSLGISLSLWYFFIFVTTALIPAAFSSYQLLHSLKAGKLNSMSEEWDVYRDIYSRGGMEKLLAEIQSDVARNPGQGRIIHLIEDGRTVYLNLPEEGERLVSPVTLRDQAEREGENFFEIADERLEAELYSGRLGENLALQIGFIIGEEEEDLFHFVLLFLPVFGIVLLVGFGGALFFSRKAMKPLLNLTETVRAVTAGRMGARVPLGRGGSELDELVVLLNEMLERNERLIGGMKGTLDNVAHDFRTPLTRMRILLERALVEGGSREDLEGVLMDCGEEVERLAAHLSTLMDISEAETGVMNLDRASMPVGAFLEEMADMYHFFAEEKGLTIRVDVPDDLVIYADRQRIFQVMCNLLDNAVKYTGQGGSVTIGARDEGDLIRIEVSDTGVGIPEKDLTRIFERLYRVDPSRSEKGLGLGLSIARAIARAHGGSLTVASVLGESSTFSLRIPASLQS